MSPKEYLTDEEFQTGVYYRRTFIHVWVYQYTWGDPWLIAFAPIQIITAGGFLAVSNLKNRDSTGDIDYLIEPEWANEAGRPSSKCQTQSLFWTLLENVTTAPLTWSLSGG